MPVGIKACQNTRISDVFILLLGVSPFKFVQEYNFAEEPIFWFTLFIWFYNKQKQQGSTEAKDSEEPADLVAYGCLCACKTWDRKTP